MQLVCTARSPDEGRNIKIMPLISFSAAQAIVAQLLSSTTEPMSPADPETIVTSLVGIFVVENYFGYLPSPRDYSGLEDDTPFVHSKHLLDHAKKSLVELPTNRVEHWQGIIAVLESVCQPYSVLRNTFHRYFGAVHQALLLIQNIDMPLLALKDGPEEELYKDYLRALHTIQEYPLSSQLNLDRLTTQLKCLLEKVRRAEAAEDTTLSASLLACLVDLLIVSHTIEDADCAENNHKALVAIETHLVALFPGDDLERAIQFVFSTHLLGFPYFMLRFCKLQLYLFASDYASIYRELSLIGCHSNALEFLILANQVEMAKSLLLIRLSTTLQTQYSTTEGLFTDFPDAILKKSAYPLIMSTSVREPFLHYLLLLGELADNRLVMRFVLSKTTKHKFRAASDLGLWYLNRYQEAHEIKALHISLRYYLKALRQNTTNIAVKDRCGTLYLLLARRTYSKTRRNRCLEKAYELCKSLCESTSEQYKFYHTLGLITLEQGHVSEALCHLYSACRAAISCDQVDKTPFLTYLSAINRLPGLHCQRFNIEELSLVIQFLWTFQERQSTSVDVRSLIIVGALVLRAIRLFPRIKQSKAFVASFCRWEEISQTTKNLILQLHVTAIKKELDLIS